MAAVEQLPQAALEVFPLGVASGDAAPQSAVVWTRYTGAQMLRLVVFPQAGGAPVVDVVCAPADGGFVHVTVDGLSAGVRYQFAFITVEGGNAVRSPLGRFRAALADASMDPVVLGATACTSNARPRFRTLEQAGTRQDLDAFCLLGDTTYNDGAESLADYRAKWGENLAKEGYRALRASTSLLCTWDDHEVGNNWSPETIAPQKLATATQAFFEHQPVRRIPGAEGRLWRSYRWGRTVEVFVLDGRSERRPSTRTSPQCQYISPEQMAWLKAGLAASPAVFKVLMNSVPMGNFPQTFNLGDVLLDPEDRWQGYKPQQDELLTFIETTPVRGVVFLSGDFHLACTGRVSPDGLGSQTLEVLAGPGAQFPNPLHYLLRGPQFDFGTSTFNYVALHCDPASRQMRVAYHNEEGNIFHEQTFVLP
jgi:alkaline phosphatase D